MPIPAPFVVNMEDSRQIAKDIAAAQENGADVIIAFPHWGIEYALLPSAEQRKRAEWLLEKGVHHVIGCHPHVVQPFEVSTDEGGEQHLTVFSLGNYVSNMQRPNTDGGAMVSMTLTKKAGKTSMTACDYSLFWVARPQTSRRKNFRIYPADAHAHAHAHADTYAHADTHADADTHAHADAPGRHRHRLLPESGRNKPDRSFHSHNPRRSDSYPHPGQQPCAGSL